MNYENKLKQLQGLRWCMAICCLGVAGCGDPGKNLTAEQIMDRIGGVYTTCGTYQDEGEVRTVFHESGGRPRTVVKPFTTAFIRPDRFRFEFRSRGMYEEEDQYMIHAEGDKIQSWWDILPGVKHPRSLGMAIAGATGVSGGSALNIPNLLMPEILDAWSILDIREMKRLENADWEGTDCFRIAGLDRGGDRTVLWIDSRRFLVLRVDEEKDFGNFQTETRTSYRPEVNRKVREEDLAFAPMKRKE